MTGLYVVLCFNDVAQILFRVTSRILMQVNIPGYTSIFAFIFLMNFMASFSFPRKTAVSSRYEIYNLCYFTKVCIRPIYMPGNFNLESVFKMHTVNKLINFLFQLRCQISIRNT